VWRIFWPYLVGAGVVAKRPAYEGDRCAAPDRNLMRDRQADR